MLMSASDAFQGNLTVISQAVHLDMLTSEPSFDEKETEQWAQIWKSMVVKLHEATTRLAPGDLFENEQFLLKTILSIRQRAAAMPVQDLRVAAGLSKRADQGCRVH